MRPCLSLRPIPALVVAALFGSQAAMAQATVTVIVPNTAITGYEPVPLRAQVAGTPNPQVSWKIEPPNVGEVTQDAAGNWWYQPPQHREDFLNVQLRATSNAAPGRSGVGTLVLMPTNHLWSVINSTLNGEPAPGKDDKATAVGGKRKAGAAWEGGGPAAAKRQLGAAGAIAAAAPAKQKWEPATWMQANGNAHFEALPFHDGDPYKLPLLVPAFQIKPFARGRAGALPLPPLAPNQNFILGYRTPLELEWDPGQGFQATGQQLTHGEAGNQIKEDVTGRTSIRLSLEASGRCWVHALMPDPSAPGRFLMEAYCADPKVRGLLPLLGLPAGAPSLDDGTGDGARFTDPLSLAFCFEGKDGKVTRTYLACTDAGSHAIRCIAPDTTVTTPWGKPGEPGHQDGAGDVARFHHPTFLANSRSGGFHVSDTGNQAIRWVDGDQVRTVAGIPGQAGHRDGPAGRPCSTRPRASASARTARSLSRTRATM